MSNTLLNGLMPEIVRTAYRAGQAVLDIYETDFEITRKSDNSPLTAADQESHRIIVNDLKRTGIPILSEEGRDIPFAKRKEWPQMWVVDPLDGTKEFIKKNGEFTVNIALVEKQVPIAGVVYAPVLKKLYFAGLTIGAYLLSPADKTILCGGDLEDYIRKSARLPIADPTHRKYTVIGSRSHATSELDDFVASCRKEHGEIDFISAGSSLKFCLVAEGRADCYPRLGPTMEWDTAAGQTIAVYAGLEVLNYETNEHLTYNKENLKNPFFIVKKSVP